MKITARTISEKLAEKIDGKKTILITSKKSIKYGTENETEGKKFTVSIPDVGNVDIKVKKDDFSDIDGVQHLIFLNVRCGFIAATNGNVYLWILAENVIPVENEQ